MSADTRPSDAETIRKRAIQLRAFIDQGEFIPGENDDDQLLTQVFTDDELVAIEDHYPKLHLALMQLEDAFDKATEAGAALEACQNAIDAHAVVISLEESVDDAADDEEQRERDHEALGDDDGATDDDDPDADLDDDDEGEEE